MYVQLATTRGVKRRLVEQEAHWKWDVTTALYWLESSGTKTSICVDCSASTLRSFGSSAIETDEFSWLCNQYMPARVLVRGGGEAVIDKILEIKNFIVHSGSLLLNLVNYWMRKLQNDKQKHFKKKIYTYVEKWHIFFAYNLVTDYQRSFVPSVMFVNKKPVCTVAVLAAAQSSFFGGFFKNALCHFILHN